VQSHLAICRSLAVLQRMGLVSIEDDGAGGRRNNVAPTPKGRAQMAALSRCSSSKAGVGR
jgi:DNA-binding MarR family transcriptional regulator